METLRDSPPVRPPPVLQQEVIDYSVAKRNLKKRRRRTIYQPLPVSHSRHATPRHIRSLSSLSKTTSRKRIQVEIESAWKVDNVTMWLREIKLDLYIPLFCKHAITGASLLSKHMTREALAQMGIQKMGHVLCLLDAIDQLRKQ
jgi:hypothetical protein